MRRGRPAALALAALAACGGGAGEPYCGDGHQDPDEQCDDGNDDETDFCRSCLAWLPARTTVGWRFNADAAEGFDQDGCEDLGVENVEVILTGAIEVRATGRCSDFRVIFEELPPGPYLAQVRPLDADDAALTRRVERQVTAATTDTTHTINVPPEAWIGPYAGSFFFTIHWGGVGCGDASPPIAQQVITLMVGGLVVAQATLDGQMLDGSAAGPCSATEHQAIQVPFGPATIEIAGQDLTGAEHYHGSFDTFVGAGAANPTLDYDVPTIYDAMPPAPPDGGV